MSLTSIFSLLQQSDISDQEKISEIKKILFDLEAKSFEFKPALKLSDQVFKTIDSFVRPIHPTQLISTGHEHFDNAIQGFMLGDLVVVGGRPGMGKSSFCVDLCMRMSKQFPCLYLTLDMEVSKLSYYFIANKLKIKIDDLLSRLNSKDSIHELIQAHEAFKDMNILLNDFSGSNFPALKKYIQKNVEENNTKIIFIENLQSLFNNKYKYSRESEISSYVHDLKNLASDLNVLILASSSLSRSVETRGGPKRPMLSDLRDSGSIEEVADKVLMLFRPSYYGITQDEDGNEVSQLMEVLIAKDNLGHHNNRTVRFKFDNKTGELSYFNFEENVFEFDVNRLNELLNKNDNNN